MLAELGEFDFLLHLRLSGDSVVVAVVAVAVVVVMPGYRRPCGIFWLPVLSASELYFLTAFFFVIDSFAFVVVL